MPLIALRRLLFPPGRLIAHALILILAFFSAPAGATMPPPQGTIPPEVASAFAAGLFDLPARAPTATSVAQSRWYVPVIMVGFSDNPLTYTAADFDTALFDTTGSTPLGSVYDYYQWASNGRLRVTGKVVATVNLPFPRDYYAYNSYGLARESTPNNMYEMVLDALHACSSGIDWSQFDVDHDGMVDMLWVIHQGVAGETTGDRTCLWSITSRLTGGWRFGAVFDTNQLLPGSTNQYFQIDRFSALPELSSIIPGRRAEIGTYCHEFGHALGMPDLYDTSGFPSSVVNSGPGRWSLMSYGGYGGQGLTPERPAGLGGWCTMFLGWTSTFRPQQDTTITLRPLMRGDPLVEVWSEGEVHGEHFLIENRQLESFDSTLPAPGILITHVDEGTIAQLLPSNRINAGLTPGLMIVEADGNDDLFYGGNRGDAGDPFPGATDRTYISDDGDPNLRTFKGGYTNLALADIAPQGKDLQFRLQVREPGWLVPRDVTAPDPVVLDSPRPAHWAATDHEHRVFVVRSEYRSGIPQIVLYSRLANVWQPAEVISHSSAAALDPAVAVLPGGDLAVVWTDVRDGHSQIFYSARIRGQWTLEQPISGVSGDSHHPDIGTDASGMVEVVWLNELAGERQLCFKRFAYLSPFGTPRLISFIGEQPDPPVLVTRRDGSAVVIWSDRAVSPARLYFSHFDPDSGLSARQTLTYTPAAPQLSLAAAVDREGSLHCVWQVSGAGISELHYQIRYQSNAPYLSDTLLESSTGSLVQNPSVACDDSGGVHVAYEDWSGALPVVRYKLHTPQRGWDVVGADLCPAGEGATRPMVLPHGPGDVTVLQIGESNDQFSLVERRRMMGTNGTTSVPVAIALDGTLRAGPNPLRAGGTLRVSGSVSGEPDRLEVYDLAGRRVASVPTIFSARGFTATLDAGLTSRWADGVYFARLRGQPRSVRFVVIH